MSIGERSQERTGSAAHGRHVRNVTGELFSNATVPHASHDSNFRVGMSSSHVTLSQVSRPFVMLRGLVEEYSEYSVGTVSWECLVAFIY